MYIILWSAILGVEYEGNYYSVIFGEYTNGGFCCIPNWEVGCELSSVDDVFWNKTSIGNALKDRHVGKIIAMAIAGFLEMRREC